MHDDPKKLLHTFVSFWPLLSAKQSVVSGYSRKEHQCRQYKHQKEHQPEAAKHHVPASQQLDMHSLITNWLFHYSAAKSFDIKEI